MSEKFMADVGATIDLFHGTPALIENGMIGSFTLSGPDFDIDIDQQPFDPAPATAVLNPRFSRIKLAALAGFNGPLPALSAPLRVLNQAGVRVIERLGALEALIEPAAIANTLTIERGAARLTLGLEPWRLVLARDDGSPVGKLTLPVGPGIEFALSRLVLDASGVVECSARLNATRVDVGGVRLEISEGSLALRGGRVEARLDCTMALPYFGNAQLGLTLNVSGELSTGAWFLSGATRIGTNEPWRDPSGLLSFDQMSVAVDFARAADGNFGATIRLGGRVTFAKSLVPESVGRWFEGLFDNLSVNFENVVLQDPGALPSFAFAPTEGLRLKAMGVFDLRVPRLKFDQDSLTLQGGIVRIDAGGAVLSGTVGDIRINLVDGPTLDTTAPATLSIELAAPGGFKARAQLVDESTDFRQVLAGAGSLSSPALAPFEVSFTIGRSRDRPGDAWRPVISIMVSREDVNIPLFPGVVITRIELGAGINRTVAGVTGLTLADARRRLEAGLPDIMSQDSWIDAEADLTVVARIFTESSQTSGDRNMSLYVADLAVVMTSEFQFAAFGRLWLHTSRADARTPDFQRLPAAVGLALFDGMAPSLRVTAMTRPDGRSSLAKSIPAGQLLGMQVPRTQLAFEATPAGMALVLGPLETGLELGPLRVAGSTMFALRSARGTVYALSRSTLSASFRATAGSVRIGPATLSGSVGAGFSATLALLGDFRDSKLTVYGQAQASCWVELALHVRIGFEIRISVGFGSVRISWHEDWDFTFRLHVDLDLQVMLRTDGGIGVDGRAALAVNVLGISASLSLRIVSNEGLVVEGKQMYDQAHADINHLLGAS